MNILICGAAGFIGSNLANHYADTDHNVYGTYHINAYDPDIKINWRCADLTDEKSVDNVVKDIDIVIQCAAYSTGSKDAVERPWVFVTDNAIMNSRLLRSAQEHGVKHFIFLSCSVMYPSGIYALTEDHFDPYRKPDNYPYFGPAWTKVYIEKMCEFYATIGKMKTTAIRHSNIYGPYDKFDDVNSHVFAATISKVMNAKKGVEIWGNGQAARDFLHVFDLVSFIDAVIEKQEKQYDLYNAGSGIPTTIESLTKQIMLHANKDLPVSYNLTRPDIPTRIFLSYSKAKEELSWSPSTDLGTGIQMTLDWYKRRHHDQKMGKRMESEQRV